MFFRRNYAYWIPRKYRKMYDEAIRLDAQKEMRDEAHAQGRAEGLAEGRAEALINIERERHRANKAEAEITRLREENLQLKKIINNRGEH